MDGLEWKTLLKLMIWGYHYFRKHLHGEGHIIGENLEEMFEKLFKHPDSYILAEVPLVVASLFFWVRVEMIRDSSSSRKRSGRSYRSTK